MNYLCRMKIKIFHGRPAEVEKYANTWMEKFPSAQVVQISQSQNDGDVYLTILYRGG